MCRIVASGSAKVRQPYQRASRIRFATAAANRPIAVSVETAVSVEKGATNQTRRAVSVTSRHRAMGSQRIVGADIVHLALRRSTAWVQVGNGVSVGDVPQQSGATYRSPASTMLITAWPGFGFGAVAAASTITLPDSLSTNIGIADSP